MCSDVEVGIENMKRIRAVDDDEKKSNKRESFSPRSHLVLQLESLVERMELKFNRRKERRAEDDDDDDSFLLLIF